MLDVVCMSDMEWKEPLLIIYCAKDMGTQRAPLSTNLLRWALKVPCISASMIQLPVIEQFPSHSACGGFRVGQFMPGHSPNDCRPASFFEKDKYCIVESDQVQR
jgi:hypothetical protein